MTLHQRLRVKLTRKQHSMVRILLAARPNETAETWGIDSFGYVCVLGSGTLSYTLKNEEVKFYPPKEIEDANGE